MKKYEEKARTENKESKSVIISVTEALLNQECTDMNFTFYKNSLKDLHVGTTLESLYKYPRDTVPNRVYLDEFCSIRKCFDSYTTSKNHNKIIATFKWIIKYCKHLIVMDADLSMDDVNLINSIRQDEKAEYIDY